MSSEWTSVTHHKNTKAAAAFVQQKSTDGTIYSKSRFGVRATQPVFSRRRKEEPVKPEPVINDRDFPALAIKPKTEVRLTPDFRGAVQKCIANETRSLPLPPRSDVTEQLGYIHSFKGFNKNRVAPVPYPTDEDHGGFSDEESGPIRIRRKKNQPVTDRFQEVTRLTLRPASTVEFVGPDDDSDGPPPYDDDT
jgi:hypothetical protein